MNSIRHNANKLTTAVCLLVVCSSLLFACGDGSDGSDTTAGIGGTGIVSGKITGFGSIHVNGGKFETDGSQFDVDGETFVGQEGQNKLAVGMVVRLRVETEDGVFGSTALEVVYDDEIEGPLTNIISGPTIKTGTVFGKTITFDQANTKFEDTSFNSIGQNGGPGVEDVIEVSGFRVSPTEITATYVRFIEDLGPDSEVELRGTITDYSPGLPETFKIDGITIETDVDTEIEAPNDMLVDGLYVEVEGIIQNATLVLAEEIESEDEDFDDDIDKISLEGVVAGFTDIALDFFVGSQRVNANGAQFSPAGLTLVDGLNIEVEGPIIGGILIADEVEEE
ncbi:MAG: hypothetical protein GY785_17930 [Gammaproteobacteria bacterium]|nr:hypothetical protein [Gammaproteobacteria bacterium]